MDKKINDFVIFCLECYKAEFNLNGKKIYEIFEKHGVFDYLRDGYDMLHTQGKEWLMNDITQYFKNRGVKLND